jgi:hypothetical protein
VSDIEFSYRLPVSFVRVTGTRSSSSDVDDAVTVDCRAAVTTEIGADTRTRCPVRLTEQSMATQKSTWTLTTDGRLTGADSSTTVERLANWSAALQAGGTVLGIAGPALLGAGPPGWLVLAGAVGAASLGTAYMAGHVNITAVVSNGGVGQPPTPPDSIPAEWDVHAKYVKEHQKDAQALANLRSCLAEAAWAHARAVRAEALADQTADQCWWAEQVERLKRVLVGASMGAARAEANYATWLAAQVKVTIDHRDFRIPVDLMPDQSELEGWAADPQPSPIWAGLLRHLHLAVSVDLEHVEGDNELERNLPFTPTTDADEVHYRPPRPAVVRTWKATPRPSEGLAYALELQETQHVLIACPGNEARMSIMTSHDSTNAVAVTFDESGALSKVTTELKDPALQRATDLSAMLSRVGEAVTVGKDLREAVSPPSLVDRAAEAKAAAELGLVPTSEDPLKALKAQVAEQQLRAQLKLAEQLQRASTFPVFVAVSTTG